MHPNDSKYRPTGISVVIPTYNRLDTLVRAIESVRSMRPTDVEIIVIDDGSEDDPRPHLPTLNASLITIKAYRFEQNRGPQAARNLGIRRARFSHIAFLDSDDEFTQSKVDTILAEIECRDFDLLFHAVRGMPRYDRLATLWDRRLRALLPFHWLCAFYNPVITPALVVRRRCRLGVTRLRHCEDWAFLLRYADAGLRVRYLREQLSLVHRPLGSSGGLSAAIWKMRKGEFTARRVLLRKPAAGKLARWCAGSVAGLIRVIADILRARYRKADNSS
jgi:glycosyltransferase involved in cell wall biosynthesis